MLLSQLCIRMTLLKKVNVCYLIINMLTSFSLDSEIIKENSYFPPKFFCCKGFKNNINKKLPALWVLPKFASAHICMLGFMPSIMSY